MAKLNCWEFKKCGREPSGLKVNELGVCSAATESKVEGTHSGKCGGRVCWVIAGTLCKGKVQGTYAQKEQNCLACDFYLLVRKEEAKDFLLSGEVLRKLR